MTKKGFWTLRYTLLNAAYFAAFCTIHAYAAFSVLLIGTIVYAARVAIAIFAMKKMPHYVTEGK